MTHKTHLPNDRDPETCEACARELAELDALVDSMTLDEKVQALEAVGFSPHELASSFSRNYQLILLAIARASRRS